jgi:hypothetical protein
LKPQKISGYKIKYSSRFFKDNHISNWGAIHYHEANAYHIKYPYPKKTVIMQRGMSPLEKKETMEVLRDELSMMDKGMSYKRAHLLANGLERRLEKEGKI